MTLQLRIPTKAGRAARRFRAVARARVRAATPWLVVAIWLVSTISPAVSTLASHLRDGPGAAAAYLDAELTGEEQWLGVGHLGADEQECDRSIDCLLSSLKGKSGELPVGPYLEREPAIRPAPRPWLVRESPRILAAPGPRRARAPPSTA